MRTASTGELSFFTSYNTELDWDFVFVEAQTIDPVTGEGRGDWTTLPERDGITHGSRARAAPSGWGAQLHARTLNYQTCAQRTRAPTTTASRPARPVSGTPPAATPAAGRSGTSTCPATTASWSSCRSCSQPTGARWSCRGCSSTTRRWFDGATVHETTFETDDGGWEIPGAHPAGPSTNVNDWIRRERIPFEDASVTKTDFGLYFGFGFEGVDAGREQASS